MQAVHDHEIGMRADRALELEPRELGRFAGRAVVDDLECALRRELVQPELELARERVLDERRTRGRRAAVHEDPERPRRGGRRRESVGVPVGRARRRRADAQVDARRALEQRERA